jgi:hypothetical protein
MRRKMLGACHFRAVTIRDNDLELQDMARNRYERLLVIRSYVSRVRDGSLKSLEQCRVTMAQDQSCSKAL